MGISTNEMHLATFLFAFCYIVFFLYQIICYKTVRPSDKNRLYYSILVCLLIQYDIFSAFLPDPKIDIPVPLQKIIEFAATILVSVYLPYYFYKAFELTRLKFFASWGAVIFLLLPSTIFFLIPYYITKDFQACRKAAVVISCLYEVAFAYFLTQAIREKSSRSMNSHYKTETIGICVGVVFWVISLLVSFFEKDLNAFLEPIIHLKNGSEVVAVLSTNFALLAMTILFIRHREEYQFRHALMLLEEVNADLTSMVEKRTRELEMVCQDTRKHRIQNNCHKFCLTSGEIRIVMLLEKGGTYKEIGGELSISEYTVKKHIGNIFDKTGVSSRRALLDILEAS